MKVAWSVLPSSGRAIPEATTLKPKLASQPVDVNQNVGKGLYEVEEAGFWD